MVFPLTPDPRGSAGWRPRSMSYGRVHAGAVDAPGGRTPMDMPQEAERRIAHDRVAWLTTITDRGAPAPNPVWFVPESDDLVIFSAPQARKVSNIEQGPAVTLHFNSDPDGGDVVVITGM